MRKPNYQPKNRIIFLSLLLIAIMGFSVYLNSLNGKFVWDDETLIKNNPYIRSWPNLPKIFSRDIGRGTGEKFCFYRPIQVFTYLCDYSIYGLNIRGYHLTSILLHILVASLICWLVNILFGNGLISLIASLLFVIHPIHTEAVSYISCRADLLASLFILLSLVFYIKYLNSKKIIIYLIVLMTYLFAILSKEFSLILPLLLLLYHYVFKIKFSLRRFFPILASGSLFILLRLMILPPPLSQRLSPDTLFQRMPGVSVALCNYLRLLFLPFHLHMEYGYSLFKPTEPKAILGYIIFLILLSWGIKNRKGNKLISFSMFWFFISLFPQSNVYPLNAYMAEHWLYLPSLGFFLILAQGLEYLYRTKGLRILSIIFLTAITGFYSLLTIKQNNYWREPVSFYERTLRYAPNSPTVLNNLGNSYYEGGRLEEAITLYKKAIEIDPLHVKSYNNLANVYSKLGMTEEAIGLCKKAITIDPNYAMTYYNLANAYAFGGNMEEAISFYKKSIMLIPDNPVIYNNLGNVYRQIGKAEEAITFYKKAIELNPRYATAYNNMGIVLSTALDKEKEAIAAFIKAIESAPNFADAHYNLSVAYYYTKQYELATKHYREAIRLGYKVNPNFTKLLKEMKE